MATDRPAIDNNGSPRLYKELSIGYHSSLRWESEEAVGNMNSSGAVRQGRYSALVCASLGQMKNQEKLLVHVMYLEVL
jgi:hypothetical protein